MEAAHASTQRRAKLESFAAFKGAWKANVHAYVRVPCELTGRDKEQNRKLISMQPAALLNNRRLWLAAAAKQTIKLNLQYLYSVKMRG